MSQRVIANYSRARPRLLRAVLLVGLFAMTACTPPKAPAELTVLEVPPDATHTPLWGAPGPTASQPFGVRHTRTAAVRNKPTLSTPEPAAAVVVSSLPATVSAAPPPPPPAEAAVTVVASNVGHTLSDIRRTLGPPADRHTSGGMQTWTYRRGGCALELTSYFDVSSGDFVVLSQHVLPVGTNNVDCIQQNGT